MTSKVSPLAPKTFPCIPEIQGVKLAVGSSGIKYGTRDDVLLVYLSSGTKVAGVFTKSLMPSAPVEWCKKSLKHGQRHARALIVNAGNANAFTGQRGRDSLRRIIETTADGISCRPSQVFAASTGVIGEQLDDEAIRNVIPVLKGSMSAGSFEAAARAIMTTDTYPKASHQRVKIDGVDVNIAGIAKGAAMIAPDMSTMLSFIFTDAMLPAEILQTCLSEVTDRSFNCITVDSDMSTSDTVLLFATGHTTCKAIIKKVDDPVLDDFRNALKKVSIDLAKQIVRDGEGASKFITVKVSGADNNGAARAIAFSIANSPLVKTAIAGEDANWGRIVMAVGKSGEKADRDNLRIQIGSVVVADRGGAVIDFDERLLSELMQKQEIDLTIDVGIANGKAEVWTCDLTQEYVRINADYRS